MALRNVTGARCTICGKVSPAEPETTVCPHCSGILDIEYDYDYIRSCLRKHPLQERSDPTMWRYLELLPVEGLGTRPRLRVGGSPLYRADALGKEVYAGPVEASAIGNILVQMWGRGEIKDLDEAGRIVARSFPVKRYVPGEKT